MAEYTRYLFKTDRKFYGEAIVVTQEIEPCGKGKKTKADISLLTGNDTIRQH